MKMLPQEAAGVKAVDKQGGGSGRLLTFLTFRVGAYSRWAVNRINTASHFMSLGIAIL